MDQTGTRDAVMEDILGRMNMFEKSIGLVSTNWTNWKVLNCISEYTSFPQLKQINKQTGAITNTGGAVPSDQGSLPTSTRHAIGLGLQDWLDSKGIESDQQEIIENLLRMSREEMNIEDTNEMAVDSFNGRVLIVENENKIKRVKIKITSALNNPAEIKSFATQEQYNRLCCENNSCLILVWKVPSDIAFGRTNELHAIYAKTYDPITREFGCINSWGYNIHPYPVIPDDFSNVSRVYRIYFSLIGEDEDRKARDQSNDMSGMKNSDVDIADNTFIGWTKQDIEQLDSEMLENRIWQDIQQKFSYKSSKDIIKMKGIMRDVHLMILYILCNRTSLKSKIRELCLQPVHLYRDLDDVEKFVSDVIQTGLVEEIIIKTFFIGNCSVGKSSVAKTVEKGVPFLTGMPDNLKYKETKILDVVENYQFPLASGNDNEKIDTKETDSKVLLISFLPTETNETVENETKVIANLYDIGGHSEYYVATSLFVTDNGIFAISFDGHDYVDAHYNNRIGNYIRLVCDSCPNPVFVLIATKMDMFPGFLEFGAERDFGNAEETAKNQLEFITKREGGKIKPILLTKVIQTSAQTGHRLVDDQNTLIQRLRRIALHPDLMKVNRVPFSWWNYVKSIQDIGLKVTYEEAFELYEKHKSKQKLSGNENVVTKMKREDINKLKQVQKILKRFSNMLHITTDNIEYKDSNVAEIEVINDESFLKKIKDRLTIGRSLKSCCFNGRKENDHQLKTFESKEYSMETQKDVELIFSIFARTGYILHFENIDELSKQIYTKPMYVIKSLRAILRHDYRNPINDDASPRAETWLDDIEHTGMMHNEAFDILFASKTEDENEPPFSKEDTRYLLVNLKIAWSVDDQRLFIPSLILEEHKSEIIRKANSHIGSNYKNCLGIMFKFSMETKTIGLYHELLMNLQSKKYCGADGNAGVKYDQGFCQKIENRKPGWVSGMKGRLQVMEDKNRWYEFLIMELETDFKKEASGLKEQEIPFSRYRCLVIFVSPIIKGESSQGESFTKGAWITVGIFDNILSDIIANRGGDLERGIICCKCAEESKCNSMLQALQTKNVGYFIRKREFACDHASCSNRKHSCSNLDEDHKILMEPTAQDSQCLRMFLKNGIETIDKIKFKERKIKDLVAGDQIWIYRDRTTNCISKYNPYAHVVVYVGNKEVIHVTPAKCGCCKGVIRKENINEVIKPEEDTFLGHNIPGSQHSINIREEIAKRAEACIGIKFNYDHHNNCETFANMLMGFDFSVQGETSHSCISGLFGCVNCCKRKRHVGNLRPKIRKRLRKRGLISSDEVSCQRSGACS